MEQNQSKPNKTEDKASKQTKSKSKLDVKVLKTYQPVEFGPQKRLETYFHPARPMFKGLTITFDPEMQLIVLRQEGVDCKVVVPANVEYMEIEGI